MSKIYAFDLDDTLCFRPKEVESLGVEKYKHCLPIQEMIDICNRLYDEGNTIYIYTARGMSTLNGNLEEINTILYPQTYEDLKKWGVKFNKLIMGKLHYDLLIDDKAMDIETAKKFLKK